MAHEANVTFQFKVKNVENDKQLKRLLGLVIMQVSRLDKNFEFRYFLQETG